MSAVPALARRRRRRGLVDEIGAEILLRLIRQPDPALGHIEQHSLAARVVRFIRQSQAIERVLTILAVIGHRVPLPRAKEGQSRGAPGRSRQSP